MNNKAQGGIVASIFLFILFLVLWFSFVGSWIGQAGEMAVTAWNAEGIEAFVLMNLNFFVFIGVVLGMVGYMYFSGGGA